MPTKGPSNLYIKSERINFEYSDDFVKKSFESHYIRHGKNELKISESEYKEKAITFANKIDKINHESFVDEHGTTYKRSKSTNEFALISDRGNVITYYKMSSSKKWGKLIEKRSRKKLVV